MKTPEELGEAMGNAIGDAVEEEIAYRVALEREACALLADQYANGKEAAAAIRARKDQS